MLVKVEGSSTDLPKQGNELDSIKAWCMELYRWSKDRHEQTWCNDHYQFYTLYRNFTRQGIDPDDRHSNISLGLAFPLVKILSARLCAPWQAGDRLIECNPVQSTGKTNAPLISAYINTQLVNRIPRAFSKLELVKESAIALGRGVLKPIVRKVPSRTILSRKPVMMQLPMLPMLPPVQFGSVLGWERKPIQEVMTFEYVDPFQFWYVGTDRWADGADQTLEVAYLTPAEVANRVESGEFNIPFQYDENAAQGYDQFWERRRTHEYGFGDNVRSGWGGQGPKPHRYVEIQGLIETRKRKNGLPVFEQMIVGILDEKWLVKKDRLASFNGKPEYIVYELFQDFAGERPMGLVEPAEQALFAIDEFVSIALDNARKIIESPLAVDPDATDQTEIYLGAAAINWIRNPGAAIKPIEMKDLPRSFYELLTYLNEVVYRVTGLSDMMGGVNTGQVDAGAQTARGMNLLANLAASRLSPILTKMDHELYRPLAEWIHETARLRMMDPQYVRVQNAEMPSFQQLRPENLESQMEYSFNTKALDAASGQRRSEFIQMISMLTQIAQSGQLGAQGYYLDSYEIARMLMTEFDRGAEIDAIIKRLQMPGMPMVPPGGPFATPMAGAAPGAPMPAGPPKPPGMPPPQSPAGKLPPAPPRAS